MAKANKTESDYRAMFARIETIEKSDYCKNSKDFATYGHGYLVDEVVDNENTRLPYNHPDFWNEMYCSLCMSAGMRAEEYGFSINEALGEVIY